MLTCTTAAVVTQWGLCSTGEQDCTHRRTESHWQSARGLSPPTLPLHQSTTFHISSLMLRNWWHSIFQLDCTANRTTDRRGTILPNISKRLVLHHVPHCTMGEIGLLNVTQKYFITFFCFGTTLKFNYLLCGYSYWRINYIFVMTTKLTLMQQFLTLFNPILAKWPSFAHSAMSPCTQAKTRSSNQLLG